MHCFRACCHSGGSLSVFHVLWMMRGTTTVAFIGAGSCRCTLLNLGELLRRMFCALSPASPLDLTVTTQAGAPHEEELSLRVRSSTRDLVKARGVSLVCVLVPTRAKFWSMSLPHRF